MPGFPGIFFERGPSLLLADIARWKRIIPQAGIKLE